MAYRMTMMAGPIGSQLPRNACAKIMAYQRCIATTKIFWRLDLDQYKALSSPLWRLDLNTKPYPALSGSSLGLFSKP